MVITKLYTDNNKSYFTDEDAGCDIAHALGVYSEKYAACGFMFREFKAGARFDWHNAPQPQYIVYLEGEVEVVASGGERRVFKAGDVLFATDVTGEGHVTTTLTDGKSVVITT